MRKDTSTCSCSRINQLTWSTDSLTEISWKACASISFALFWPSRADTMRSPGEQERSALFPTSNTTGGTFLPFLACDTRNLNVHTTYIHATYASCIRTEGFNIVNPMIAFCDDSVFLILLRARVGRDVQLHKRTWDGMSRRSWLDPLPSRRGLSRRPIVISARRKWADILAGLLFPTRIRDDCRPGRFCPWCSRTRRWSVSWRIARLKLQFGIAPNSLEIHSIISHTTQSALFIILIKSTLTHPICQRRIVQVKSLWSSWRNLCWRDRDPNWSED